MKDEIDVIVPSFRLDETLIRKIITLPKPMGWNIHYFIIVDNPIAVISPAMEALFREQQVHLLINEKNLGASASRNKGIEAGRASWILFIDDDVEVDDQLLINYANAVTDSSFSEIGFIGLTDFPPPVNAFTNAVYATQIGTFRAARHYDRFVWGVTANMMYNREKLGNLRFSTSFPKNGGGEDADLPLRLTVKHNQLFKCVPNAKVIHPWWNRGKPHFDRFIRYGIGKGHLISLHRQLCWYDFPNTTEFALLMIILIPLTLYFGIEGHWIVLLVSFFASEFIFCYLKLRHKGIASFKTAGYYLLLNMSSELGILLYNPLKTFMRRINIGFKKPNAFQFNRWKIAKAIILVIALIIYSISS